MTSEPYHWDTKQAQEQSKTYGFVDFPTNFLDIYQNKREEVRRHLKSEENNLEAKGMGSIPYTSERLSKKKDFETSRVISTLYSSIKNGKQFDTAEFGHFVRVLKKAELKKLRIGYDNNFINTSKEKLPFSDHGYLALTLGLYAQTGKKGYMQALSTLLKVNDFMISQSDSLNSLEKSLLESSLDLEGSLVSRVRESASNAEQSFSPSLDRIPFSSGVVKNLGMVMQETNRSKAYLQNMAKNGLLPSSAVVLRDPKKSQEALDSNLPSSNVSFFDPNISEETTLRQFKIPYEIISANSFNDVATIEALRKLPEEYFIFSGRGILKDIFNAEKKLIHVHPGKLPEYRGSTCPYYSTLTGDGWWTSSFIMSKEIDQGGLITQRKFSLPPSEIDATRIYDPYTRSEVLMDTLSQLHNTGTLKTSKQDLSKGIDYYLIHPVLEFIAKDSFK